MITQNNIKTVSGAKAIIETLKNLGVTTIFGYPGGVILDIYDELYKDKMITHILTRHEQSAVHAAEGYARQTGNIGVVLVTSGPGATNTVTGIANAYLDGYPLLVLTGQVSQSQLGKNAFQEVNICDIAKSCSKAVFQIKTASEIQTVITKAIELSTSGKKGPVVIDMVKDIFKTTIPFSQMNTCTNLEQNNYPVSSDSIKKLEYAINNHLKPVMVFGGGVKHSKAECVLLEFCRKTKIPVVSTMLGLGTYPQDLDNYYGMIGVFGDNCANELLKQADFVISLGARFNDRITARSAINGKLFQIDINPTEISKNIKACDYIIGDIKEVISNIHIDKSFSDWNNEAARYKILNISPTKNTNRLHSFEVIRAIEEYTKGKELTFTTEVGQHQLWAVKNLKFGNNRNIITSAGLGTMGFGLPAAIGAAQAVVGNPVVCITGDGSFQMSLHELATCKDYNLNVKIMILNNGYLGMVRQLQEKFCQGHYSQTKISNPDFVALAKSYGIDALRVNSYNEIPQALAKAFSTDKTFIIDFVVEPMETL